MNPVSAKNMIGIFIRICKLKSSCSIILFFSPEHSRFDKSFSRKKKRKTTLLQPWIKPFTPTSLTSAKMKSVSGKVLGAKEKNATTNTSRIKSRCSETAMKRNFGNTTKWTYNFNYWDFESKFQRKRQGKLGAFQNLRNKHYTEILQRKYCSIWLFKKDG